VQVLSKALAVTSARPRRVATLEPCCATRNTRSSKAILRDYLALCGLFLLAVSRQPGKIASKPRLGNRVPNRALNLPRLSLGYDVPKRTFCHAFLALHRIQSPRNRKLRGFARLCEALREQRLDTTRLAKSPSSSSRGKVRLITRSGVKYTAYEAFAPAK